MRVLILAGGGGTRLWPLSNDENPKQFIPLPGLSTSLFQITLKRALLFCNASDIIVVTSERYKNHVVDQANEIGISFNSSQLFFESKRLNTLPAILAGILFAKVNATEEVLVLPSDHILENEHSLVEAVQKASTSIQQNIAVFGIKPTSPHTGYGYIKPNQRIDIGLFQVESFKEKPDLATATSYLSKGYLWNAGIFYFKNQFFIDALTMHQPALIKHFFNQQDVNTAFDSWDQSLSMDCGLMELISTIVVSEVHTSWTDIGSFDALIEFVQPTNQSIQQIEGSGSIVITNDDIKTVFIGVEDLILVVTKNGRLVCKKGQSQLVKDIK
jgi:mannose-1-phosphate guanylyltransferase / mannose-6-phosphate isomerase